MVYTAIILGKGRQYKAETLELLSQKLKREGYSIDRVNLKHTQNTLVKTRAVVVWGEHRLTINEKIRKEMKPPYLGNPFMRVRDNENVQIRIIYSD